MPQRFFYIANHALQKKLPAHALYISLVISLIVAIFSLALILLAYYNRTIVNNHLRIEKLDRNASSGINLLLGDPEAAFSEGKHLDLFGTGADSVWLKNHQWGLFGVAIATSTEAGKSMTKAALYGYAPKGYCNAALYLADNNRPLSLCGRARIEGNAFLPEAGARRAYIEGKSYVGDRLIYGNIQKSTSRLPELNKDVLAEIEKLMDDPRSITLEDTEQDSIMHSFHEATLLISGNTIRLNNRLIKGNVIIKANKAVYVDKSAHLEDIIIVAPYIELADGFKGNLQLLATDSIYIGKSVVLRYPSAAGLIKSAVTDFQPYLLLDEGAILEGLIFSYSSVQDRKQTKISFEKNTQVEGLVYAQGYFQTKGIVKGSVLCEKLTLKTSSSVYENHLLDAEINRNELSEHFAGSNLLESGTTRKLVKWLD